MASSPPPASPEIQHVFLPKPETRSADFKQDHCEEGKKEMGDDLDDPSRDKVPRYPLEAEVIQWDSGRDERKDGGGGRKKRLEHRCCDGGDCRCWLAASRSIWIC